MKTMLTAFAAVLAFSGVAEAQETGWYVRGELGTSFEGQLDSDIAIDLDEGFTTSLAFGREIADGIRAEGELFYLDSDVEVSSGGDASSLGAFANLYYDFNRDGTVQPFLGVGAGYAQVDLNDGIIDDDDAGLAYQAKVGAGYKISDQMMAEMVYRYLVVTDLEYGTGNSGLEGDFDSQALTVGLRYKFGS